ncbi:MAG: TylF/MycF/NovP-related O-methyltransferase [Candidatus Sulfotelmatobacter sp.]
MQIILFGAGSGLADILSILPNHIQIAGLCDNDPKKHGTTVLGHRVLAPDVLNPDALDASGYDFVVITARAGDAIRTQLVERGVPREKILLYYSNFDRELRQKVNQDMEALNRHLGLGLHPLSLCTMPLWPDAHPELASDQEDYCRMMTLRLAADRIADQGVAGSIAELGVYQGELASVLNRLFPDRKLYLFDTFEGFSNADLSSGEEKNFSKAEAGDFHNTNVELVLSRMAHPKNVFVRKGYFPETASGLEDTFAFVSLDVDLYKPTQAGLHYFYPRLSAGGYIFVHDYNNRRYRGVRRAVDEFLKETGAPLVPLPDLAGTAVLSK